jgi:hypothetical protein
MSFAAQLAAARSKLNSGNSPSGPPSSVNDDNKDNDLSRNNNMPLPSTPTQLKPGSAAPSPASSAISPRGSSLYISTSFRFHFSRIYCNFMGLLSR